MSFEQYGLSPELLSGLADVRIEKPTPLQHEVLPAALQGKHMLVKSEAEDDGTFLIPALQKVVEHGGASGTQVLILTPSIERAHKIDEMVWAMGYHAQISSALVAIKGDKAAQEQAVLDGAPVIVANPGRLIEILEKNNFQLRDLKLIVIDEAHNMENFNLVNRVKDILRFVNGEPQTFILSGDENNATKQLAKVALKNPELIGFEANGESMSDHKNGQKAETPKEVDLEAAEAKLEKAEVKVVLNPDGDSEASNKPEEDVQESPDSQAEIDIDAAEEKLKGAGVKVVLKKDIPEKAETRDGSGSDEIQEVEPVMASPLLQGAEEPEAVPKNLEQGYINVPPRMKISTLMAHLEESKAKKVMVFAASKRTTDRLFRIIRKKTWGVVSISDGLDDKTYQERFARFTSGEMRVLLIGGIDANQVEIEEVEEVINYDVPNTVDEYKYRAELVGNGKASRIISLVSKMDREDISKITAEVGFPPAELPLPEDLEEKKKKQGPKKAKPDSKNSRSKGRSGNDNRGNTRNDKNRRTNNRGGNNKKPGNGNRGQGKSKKMELPKANFDGLSGGREGNASKSGGVFGWVKKLFD